MFDLLGIGLLITNEIGVVQAEVLEHHRMELQRTQWEQERQFKKESFKQKLINKYPITEREANLSYIRYNDKNSPVTITLNQAYCDYYKQDKNMLSLAYFNLRNYKEKQNLKES